MIFGRFASNELQNVFRIDSEWFAVTRNQSKTKFPIRINPNHSNLGFIRIDSDWKLVLDQSELGLICIDLDWKLGFGLVRTYSIRCLGINRMKSDWFLIVFHQTKYKTFFGLVRKQIPEWLGIALIGSEWISIR